VTADQIKLLQIARKAVEKLSNGVFDDDAYRLALVQRGGVATLPPSSKQLSPAGFERMMAMFESMGWRDSLPGRRHDHWRTLVARRGHYASPQQIRFIAGLHKQLRGLGTEYDLNGLCRRMTKGRVDSVDDLNPKEAYDLTEMLKKAIDRTQPRSSGVSPEEPASVTPPTAAASGA
jgi:hypothetical protein